ncbi:MAG: hypothetical protein DCC68_06505 [Planctomycetota bacterium]|nr:MAG: hypothetical protein DCC68_06505 [Planctomycetota bacterium]
MDENSNSPDTARARKANRRWWLAFCAYAVIGGVLGIALSTAVALMYVPISSLPDDSFEIPGIGAPPGVMIGITIFLLTRKS